jgi:NAD+ synthase
MKQRVRKLIEYTWADSLGYAVIGTPNRLEYDQGFFVKGGDGLADIKPIAKLYKTQVYALARHLGLPPAIAERDPTTETFSLPQTQEEFYFGHPYDKMDLLVHGAEEGIAAADLAPLVGMDAEGVASAYDEVLRVRKATAYLHASARVIDIDGSNHPAGR